MNTRLLKWRTQRGYSQPALAKRAGVSLQTVSRIERGVQDPSGNTLARLAVALGVRVDQLIMKAKVTP